MRNGIFWPLIALVGLFLNGCDNHSASPTTAQVPTLIPAPAPIRAPLHADKSVLLPSELTHWPWPQAQVQNTYLGVTHWLARQKDGTTCDLLRFDFAANPRLQFELYSQDQDDAKPWDNVVEWWPMGVGQAVKHLNTGGRGSVLAAWNGPFFGYYHQNKPGRAFHLAPVVINGQVHHNTANHRWTLGWNNTPTGPQLQTVHLAKRATLETFDFASGTVQNLIKDGKPLKLQPFPRPGEAFAQQPVPSTPQEAGHIPFFDHAKFSRASIAWSRDEKQLWMILVREPKGCDEGQSINDLVSGAPQSGGWNVPDVQRFWQSLLAQGKIWNAINSDAGDVGQLAYMMLGGNYTLIPPRNASPFERKIFSPQFLNAPQGGALMYFLVREGAK
ncbi:hypothetical protein IAD21_05557 [Abditibacteriota bacterium]|nr:hypothetical protein IAD21_05557 [Abditibacteriota bacterium]